MLDDKGEVLQSHPIGQPDILLPYINEHSRRVFRSLKQELVSGSPLFRLGVQVVSLPPELDPHHWSLVGLDAKGLLYWRSLRLVREQVSGKSIAVALTRVACSDKDGRLLWQLELDGSQGVLARIDPHLAIYAEGWLEIAEDGVLWVFATHLDMLRTKDTEGYTEYRSRLKEVMHRQADDSGSTGQSLFK